VLGTCRQGSSPVGELSCKATVVGLDLPVCTIREVRYTHCLVQPSATGNDWHSASPDNLAFSAAFLSLVLILPFHLFPSSGPSRFASDQDVGSYTPRPVPCSVECQHPDPLVGGECPSSGTRLPLLLAMYYRRDTSYQRVRDRVFRRGLQQHRNGAEVQAVYGVSAREPSVFWGRY
jgi:hypothetical protein